MSFTDSQQTAYNLLTKGYSIFIEGPAGTGKSYLISEFLDWSKKHISKNWLQI